MTATLDTAALLVSVAAFVAGAMVLARTADVPTGLGVFLDLLTAAGLLRLAGEPSANRLVGAAAVIALRKLATYGILAGRRPDTRRTP